jgi:hypothetical protein
MTRTGAHLEHIESVDDVPSAAVAVLRKRLASRNPFTAPVNGATRDVAERYVALTIDDPAETATIDWAVYLRRAALCLHGATDLRTHDIGSWSSSLCDAEARLHRLRIASRSRSATLAAVSVPAVPSPTGSHL